VELKRQAFGRPDGAIESVSLSGKRIEHFLRGIFVNRHNWMKTQEVLDNIFWYWLKGQVSKATGNN
jgi:hypothetical protein